MSSARSGNVKRTRSFLTPLRCHLQILIAAHHRSGILTCYPRTWAHIQGSSWRIEDTEGLGSSCNTLQSANKEDVKSFDLEEKWNDAHQPTLLRNWFTSTDVSDHARPALWGASKVERRATAGVGRIGFARTHFGARANKKRDIGLKCIVGYLRGYSVTAWHFAVDVYMCDLWRLDWA